MFDPQIVDSDMNRIFARAHSAVRGERASNVQVLSVARPNPATPPASASTRRRSRIGRKGIAFAVALLLVPALALAALYWIDVRPSSGGPHGATSMVGVRPPHGANHPPTVTETAPPADAAAYAAIEQKSDPLASDAPPRPDRRRTRWAKVRSASGSSGTDAALDQAIAEDASVTRRLNQAAIDAQPTLGYSQGVIEQSAPR